MNYNNIFAFVRQQKAFTAFMTTLVVLGSFSAVFAARGVQAETVFLKVSDTLTKNASSSPSIHTFKFTPILAMNGSAGGSSLNIAIPASFGNVANITFADITVAQAGNATTFVVKGSCDATAGTIRLTAAANQLDLALCQNTSFEGNVTKPVTIVVGNTNKIINPAAGSYEIEIKHVDSQQSQKIRIAILPKDIAMTAKVDPIFTFSVASTTAGTSVNGTSTTFTTQDSSIDFGTLVPGVVHTGAQRLNVSTNAINGFTVTAQTSSDFRSENGAIIDPLNLAASTTPIVWAAPAATLGDDKTWGHIGMTSDGYATLFSGSKWTGNFVNNPIIVLTNASSTRNASSTVGYQVQISDLQEAATDYKTNIIYVATPQF